MTEAEEPGIEFEQAQAREEPCGWAPDAPRDRSVCQGSSRRPSFILIAEASDCGGLARTRRHPGPSR